MKRVEHPVIQLEPDEYQTIRNALWAQLLRLTDKESPAFKTASLFIIFKMNEEIARIEKLLKEFDK